MTKTNPLETVPVPKLLLRLALPSILAQVISLLYSIVDRIYIGHIPDSGSQALSGIGVTVPIIMAINSFSNLIGMGGAPLATIELGKKDSKRACQILWNCLEYTVVTAISLTILLLVLKRQILKFFGTSESIYKYANDYFTICCLGSIFSMGTLVINMFLTTQGKNKQNMIIVIAGAVFNLIFDPIFIFALHLGIKGAAIVTVISQAGTTIAGVVILNKKTSLLHIQPFPFATDILKKVLALGFASFFMTITESLVSTIYNRQLLVYGSVEYIAVLSIIFSVGEMVMLPLNGIQQGAQPIISYTFGARNQKRLNQTILLTFITMGLWNFICTVLLELFAEPVFGIFTTDTYLISIGKVSLRIMILGRLFGGIQWAVQTIHRAVGEVKRTILIAMVRKIILIIPLVYILPAITNIGVNAVFMAEPIADFIAQTFSVLIFVPFYKKRLSAIEIT